MNADLKRCLLAILSDTRGHGLTLEVLHDHACARLRPKPTEEEVTTAVTQLQEAGMVRELEDPIESRWILTEKGEAWLKR